MKKNFLVAVIFLITLVSAAIAAEELRLTTILPSSNILRGSRGAIGPNYRNPSSLPDDAIDEGHLYVQNGLNIGTMYDNADPNGHSAYINNTMIAPLLVRIGQWHPNYDPAWPGGIGGGIALGTAFIHSFEHLNLAFANNINWGPPHAFRMSDGPGIHMILGRQTSSVPAGLYFRIAPIGAAGSNADDMHETIRSIRNRTDINTYAEGVFTPGGGSGLWVNGTQVSPASDISLKKDITNIPTVLDRIDTIRGVQFKWKDNSDTIIHAGVIAQEVERKFPELVSTNPAGIKHVSYEGLTGELVEAVKELKKENELLKERISRLENKR